MEKNMRNEMETRITKGCRKLLGPLESLFKA